MSQSPVFRLVNDFFACCGLGLLIWISHSMRSADIITFTGLSMIATSLKATISIKNLYNLYELCKDFSLLQNETRKAPISCCDCHSGMTFLKMQNLAH